MSHKPSAVDQRKQIEALTIALRDARLALLCAQTYITSRPEASTAHELVTSAVTGSLEHVKRVLGEP